jgi:hypothetical protein
MIPARSRTPPHSLAATEPGQLLRVQRILFGGLRALCAERGIGEGDLVFRVAADDGELRIATAAGDVVELRRDWAPFIQVALAEEEVRSVAGGARFLTG